jgi:hypothetical protein
VAEVQLNPGLVVLDGRAAGHAVAKVPCGHGDVGGIVGPGVPLQPQEPLLESPVPQPEAMRSVSSRWCSMLSPHG